LNNFLQDRQSEEIIMLENCKSAKERWGGVNTIIDRWLQGRQEMLVSYCALSPIATFDEKNSEHHQKIRHFCQTLMDYISVGHFEVYAQLVKEGRDFGDKDGLQAASKPYTIIDTTTEKLLDFNDKYQGIPIGGYNKLVEGLLEDIQEFRGTFDFFYLPMDLSAHSNVGYAFINFASSQELIAFYTKFHKQKWKRHKSQKICEIAFGRLQGKKELISQFRERNNRATIPKEDRKSVV
jgi:regulator of sigma D